MSTIPPAGSDNRFRAIFDVSLDALVVWSARGIMVDLNPAACALLGEPREALVGTSAQRFAPQGTDFAELLRDLEARGERRGQMPFARADGTRRVVEFVTKANVVPGTHLSILRDVTDARSAEHALRQSEYFLSEAQAVAHIGSWVSGLGMGDRLLWSKECYRIFGIADETPITVQTFFDHVHADDREAVAAASKAAVEGGVPYQIEHRVVRPNGDVRWVFERASIERTPDGSPLRMIGVVQDITEQRLVMEELLASEQRYRRLIESTSEGALVIGPDLVITFVNGPMAEMLGFGREDLVGKPLRAIVFDDVAEGEARFAKRSQGESEVREQRFKTKGGEELWTLATISPLFDREGKYEGVFALLTNITERRRAIEAQRRLAAIVESSEDAIVGASVEGNVTSWNRAAESLFGYRAEQMLGASIARLAPADRAGETIALARRVASGESVESFETKRIRNDGTEVDVALTLSPIHGRAGEVVGLSMIARDLTERRRAEAALRRSEEQLRQAQKLEAIGSLAGGVAHDFNNLLSVILSYASLMLSHMNPRDPLREDLEEIKRAGERAAVLTRQLLAFSRMQVLQPKVVDLARVVESMEKMLRRLLGEDIELSLALPAEVCGAFVDPTQVEQVVMNLVANARDAMPRGGKLVVEVKSDELDASRAAECPGVSPGPYVQLAVSDTGTGIDPATRSRIFDPFFTTKEKGKGTGLGLSTVQGIVHQSGGAVFVDSAPGTGTTVRVYFPRADRAVAQVVMQPSAPNLRGYETILLVEDEDQVRLVVRTILRRSGYEVLEAQNAGEAFLICEQFGAPIHLLLTDVVMPRMSGRELAERLGPIRPDMRVIFMSGHTEDAVLHHGVSEEAMEFLQKPITPDSLLRKVRTVLDAAKTVSVH